MFFFWLFVFVAPAHAGRNDAEWNPPARYDRPFQGKLTEIQLPREGVLKTCRKMQLARGLSFLVTRGCSFEAGGECTIVYIDKPYKGSSPASVRRHEIGHCNGWPAHHPD